MFTYFKRKKIKKRIDEIELELKGNRKRLELLVNNVDNCYESDVYKHLLKKEIKLEAEMQSILNALRALPFPK